ncbi:MAG TPA: anthranilate phosphoribosyltransferase [Steroidobacteraceae bacterium]|nr:anthranilate phosphoribosyltransferase [Steroidobacteraceae bacterium]
MHPLRDALERLVERRDLSESQAADLLVRLTDPQTPAPLAGAILAALRTKGVVPEEVRGFALAMRSLARRPQVPAGLPAIDIVGTGGDSSASLNISTGTALLTAACAVPVLKHGNRSVSSRTGSADVLEALGLQVPLDERAAGECLTACHFTFLFAPHYHPAMKAVAPVRAALGVRTIFNILGPLTNPAEPPYHLIGAFSLEIAQLMAQTLSGMKAERTFVVHGAEGWDEPTPVGPFTVFDVRPGKVTQHIRQPEDYGLTRCSASALAGGDASYNARALQAVLRGEDRGAHRDCLLLGTALALEVVGRVRSPREGVECAAATIDSGGGRRMLESLARFATAARPVAAQSDAAGSPTPQSTGVPS